MRKFAKFLIPALLIVAVVIACMVFASAEEKVVYVSSTGSVGGTGTVTDPIGPGLVNGSITITGGSVTSYTFTDTPYNDAVEKLKELKDGGATRIVDGSLNIFKASPLYRAFKAIGADNGTIVIMDEVKIEVADRMDGFNNYSAADTKLDAATISGNITITSNYGGVDYREASNGGAKLVIDQSYWGSSNLSIYAADTTWKDLNIEHYYNTGMNPSNWSRFAFYCGGNPTVFDTGLNIKSYDVKTGTPVETASVMEIYGGARIANVSSANVTVKSGQWAGVYGSGHSGNSTLPAKVTGNSTINISGGTIANVYGGGSTPSARAYALVEGNSAINITGGTITKLTGVSNAGIKGTLTVNIDAPAVVGEVVYGTGTTNTPSKATLSYDKSCIDAAKIDSKFNTPGTPGVAAGETVIYISNNGKGDGSSPGNPMGHDDNYNPADKNAYKSHAFYKAIGANDQAIVKNGGTIVVVDELTFDTADAVRTSLSEFHWNGSEGDKTITITSYYSGVDYRLEANGGAKIVFDTSKYGINIRFKAPMNWEYLNLETKYDTSRTHGDADFGVVMLSFYGKKVVMDKEVVVTANDIRTTGTKVNKYPSICGYDRVASSKAVTSNTEIVINEGTWGKIFGACYGTVAGGTQYGSLKGNTSVTVNGGSVSLICGTSNVSDTNVTAKVDGNVAITVNGGEVATIYGTNHVAPTGTITVNVAKGVTGMTRAWGAYNKATPANSTITYDKSVIGAENVLYWASTVEQGGEPVTPPPAVDKSVVYIASVSQGAGDGSTPKNAMGHDKDYDPTKADAYKSNAFYKAMMANDQYIVKNGGTVVIVGELAIDTADGVRTSFSEFQWGAAAGDKTITITSKYNDVDYRTTGAKLVLDTSKYGINLRVNAPTVWEYLNIEAKYDTSRTGGSADSGIAMISFMGKKAVIDEEVVVTANDIRATGTKVEMYPILCGYDRMGKSAPVVTNTDITINSGTWGKVHGATYGNSSYPAYGAIKGNVNITINGGKVSQLNCTNGVYSTALTLQVDGNVTVNVNGGEVKQIHGTNYKPATGTLHVTIAKGVTGLTRVWGSLSGSKYVGSKVTYDKTVATEDMVKYWATVEAVENTTPPPAEVDKSILYIANVSKGKGDGSTPNDVMGHDAYYNPEEKDGTANVGYKKHAFYKAIMANEQYIVKNGGTIVVVGELTFDTCDGMRQTLSEFPWKADAGEKTITITSKYNNVDYRTTKGAKVVFDTSKVGINVRIKAPTVWENLNIETKIDSSRANGSGDFGVVMLSFMGKKTTIGDNVVVTSSDISTGTKISKYPTLCGYDRIGSGSAVEANPELIINSGTWGKIYGSCYGTKSGATQYGSIKGNVSITVNGGKVAQICGTATVIDTSLTAKVDGNVTITVNGGEVVSLYGTNHTAPTGTITATVGKNVTGMKNAWGAYNKTTPANSTITFDRAAVAEEDVLYWATTVPQGNTPVTPPPQPPVQGDKSVIYIASVSQGAGDGSTPGNAMGHDKDYDPTKASAYKSNAFYKAMMANEQYIVKNGGTVVIVGELAIDTADAVRTSFSEFHWDAGVGTETITITSVYNNVDYREQGAKLVLDTSKYGINLRIKAPTVWENLNIEAKYDTSRTHGDGDFGVAMISFFGKKTVIGNNVVVTANDISTGTKYEKYPALCGYDRTASATPVSANTDITVNSGKWGNIFGATYGTVAGGVQYGSLKGNVNVTVNGGYVAQICGTCVTSDTKVTAQVDGNVTININGGEVGSIYGTNHVLPTGKITLNISENVTRVMRAWGSINKVTPANSEVTYNRVAIRDDDVLYWANVNANGNVEDQPEKEYYVVYVANKSKGKGDGSSPENAIGHAAGYDPYEKDGDAFVGYKKHAFYRAIMANSQKLAKEGGIIVVVGELTFDTANGMRTTLSEFPWDAAAGTSTITITSKHNGVDYRLAENGGAKVVLDTSKVGINLRINAPTVWKNLNIEAKYDTSRTHGDGDYGVAMLSFYGKKTVIGEEVVVTANDISTGTKYEKYPALCGYDRMASKNAVNTNTDITINSGTWGKICGSNFGMKSGNDQYGSIKGNVNITVNGGKVSQICGTSTPTDSAITAQVDGNVTININGGDIGSIYGTNHTMPTGKITLNISENATRVTKAWGSYSKVTPENSEVTYDRSVIRDDDVLYWANVNANGNVEDQPEKSEYVIYVANEAKGKGDGSSPENAMGHDAGYDPAEKDGDAFVGYKKHVFYKAIMSNNQAIVKEGGAIVVVGELTFDTADGMRASYSEFPWNAASGNNTITITSKYKGVDYRLEENGGAKVVFDTSKVGINLRIKAPTVWENLNIESKYDTSRTYGDGDYGVALISFYGKKTVIGENVVVTANDITSGTKYEKYPALCGYDRMGSKTPVKTDTNITINSGTWGKIFGSSFGMKSGNDQYGSIKGDVNITVNGGKVTQICGTSTPADPAVTVQVDGNVNININGGEIGSIYGTNHVAPTGKITLNISENATRVTRAWGAYNKVTPENSEITYDRSVIRDDDVMYWNDVNATGEIDEQPEKVQYTIYIANEAKGKGDGSSPENVMGHDAGYDPAEKDGKLNVGYKKHAFYKAIMSNNQAIVKDGGVIVVVGELTFDTSDGMRTSYSEFPWGANAGSNTITITSVDKGVDYRKQGAKIVLDTSEIGINLRIKAPTVWENINIEAKYDSSRTHGNGDYGVALISFYGKKTVMGNNVVVTANDITTGTKIEKYPALCGYDRLASKTAIATDTDITINSGTWGKIFGSCYGTRSGEDHYGSIKGNVNITVNGGKVSQICGTSNPLDTALMAQVDGNVNINIFGGEVSAVYGTNHVMPTGEIIVHITEPATRVTKAWGSYNKVTPENSYIAYDRSVIRDDEVKYWTNVTPYGNIEDQPEPSFYTVYIADVARGKGDGSSPENAMGATADYNKKYNRMLELLAIPADKRTEAQKEEFDSYKSLYKESALYRALSTSNLLNEDGRLVLVGPTTINATNSLAAPTTNGDFEWPGTGKGVITITNVDKGVDYREQGAKLIIDRTNIAVSVNVKSPMIWENIDIEYRYNSSKSTGVGSQTMFFVNGNTTVFGEGINVIPVDSHTTKSESYINIVGGHRYVTQDGDTNITIKSGTWGTVIGGNYGRSETKKLADGKTEYISHGHKKGNVNITVEGGKITRLIGTCRDDSTVIKPILTGDVNINIKGNAEVVKLYGANRYGIEGKITVNVTEDAYVGEAWGYHYTDATKDAQPKDATLNYVRSAIFAEDIKYWTTVNATGEGQPGVHGPVIYVATTSRGKGDGSSPENALGNAPDYASTRAQALAYIKANGGTNSGLPKDQSTFVTSVYKKSALYLALAKNGNQIIEEGGTIVVCEPLVINATDGMRRAFAEFRSPASGTKTIKITSVYDGVDYRWKGAKVVLDCTEVGLAVQIESPTVWDAVVIEHRYNSKNGKGVDNGALIAAAGNKLTMGYCVSSVAVDTNPDEEKRVEIYPSIAGGGRYQDFKKNTHLTINGGQWAMVVGGTWNGPNTGSATIGIGGGKIGTVCGTTKPTATNKKNTITGSVWIGLWAGEVDNVYGVGKNGIKWGSVGVGIGKDIVINGKVYATHPDYEGDEITAIAYYTTGAIDEDKLVGFTTVSPQTGSTLIYLSVVAILAIVATGVVISKKRKTIED